MSDFFIAQYHCTFLFSQLKKRRQITITISQRKILFMSVKLKNYLNYK